MPRAVIDREWCKGCELCIHVCPKKHLVLSTTLNEKGYFPAELPDGAECNGCGICVLVCPEISIDIIEDDNDK